MQNVCWATEFVKYYRRNAVKARILPLNYLLLSRLWRNFETRASLRSDIKLHEDWAVDSVSATAKLSTTTPIFYCINLIRTVFPTQKKQNLVKSMIRFCTTFKEILRKNTLRVEDRTSRYLRYRLLCEFPVNFKLFGHGLYDTDDYTYIVPDLAICAQNLATPGPNHP